MKAIAWFGVAFLSCIVLVCMAFVIVLAADRVLGDLRQQCDCQCAVKP